MQRKAFISALSGGKIFKWYEHLKTKAVVK